MTIKQWWKDGKTDRPTERETVGSLGREINIKTCKEKYIIRAVILKYSSSASNYKKITQ